MKISVAIISFFAIPLYRLWCATLHFTESGRTPVDTMNNQRDLMVFSLWHNEVFPVMFAKRDLRIVAIVSQSQDGEYLAQLLGALGMKIARGSSSRGGIKAALKTAKIMNAEKFNACITIDGPRGPRHEPKNGAIFIAARSGASIVPMRCFMKKAKIFNSWDKFRLPLPFSRVHLTFGEPYKLSSYDLNELDFEQEKKRLKERLAAIYPPEPGFLDDSI